MGRADALGSPPGEGPDDMSTAPESHALKNAFRTVLAAGDPAAIESILDASPEPLILLDVDGGNVAAVAGNAALRRAIMMSDETPRAFAELVEPRSLLALSDACKRLADNLHNTASDLEIQIQRGWWRAVLFPIRGDNGQVARVAALLCRADRDRRIREAFEENKRRLDLALRGAQAGLVEIDVKDGGAVFDENAAAMLTGRRQEFALTATGWIEHIHPDYRDRLARSVAACASGEALSLRTEHRVLRRDGSVGWVELIGRVQDYDDDGAPSRLLGIQLDVTERKDAEAKIRRLAQNDSITDLPNRSTFLRWASGACAMAHRRGSNVGVLLIDIHGFKDINESFGHLVGDEVLRIIGERLQNIYGRKRSVARFGADEFAVLLADVESVERCRETATKMVTALSQPVDALGVQIDCNVCVGFSIFPSLSGDEDAMLADADAALVFAKNDGPGTVRAFEPAIAAFRKADLRLAAELRDALENNDLRLHYQPIVRVKDGRTYGFEALLRWRNKDGDAIRPDVAVDMAERRGLIIPLTHWVLKTAFEQTAFWRKINPTLSMSVNVPPRILRTEDFVEIVGDLLRRHDLSPAALTFEITEEALADVRHVVPALEAVRALGVRVAVDDFGAGYSSLSRLRSLPVDILKIDRSFVTNLPADPVDVAIVDSIVKLAKTLDLDVVGEGIERDDQLTLLNAMGCPYIQGFFYAPALSPGEASRWVQNAPGPQKHAPKA